MKTRFEWDLEKAAANLRKHRVSFESAMRVFSDPLAFTELDRIEGFEQRWRTLGMVDGTLLLLVAHSQWEDEENDVIRIISARRATSAERRRYEHDNS
jgi:uncharacterized DUF497 family protein